MKPSATIAKGKELPPLTPEEQKEQFMKAYMQKKASLAEGILFNMIHGQIVADTKGIVKIADDMAKEFLKQVYNLELTIKEDDKPEEEN